MIDPVEVASIERFSASCTLPLFYEKGDAAPLIGTGTLLQIENRYFIVTAAHIFDEPANVECFAFPESPVKSQIFTFGKGNIWKPNNHKQIDVAVVEILEDESIRRLSTGWTFLTLDMIAQASPNGTFFLSGYPASDTRPDGKWLIGRFVTILSTRLSDTPSGAEPPVDFNLDLFFDYASQVYTLDGKAVSAPELPGVSGASIWQYIGADNTSIWTPEASVRIVGVQSAYTKGRYFRGKNWAAVASVLAQIDQDLANQINNELNIYA